MSARPSPRRSSTAFVVAILTGAAFLPIAFGRTANRLTVLQRTVTQDQGGWRVEYHLRYDGTSGIVVTPSDITLKVEGWLSNSRVASHSTPRWSLVAISGSSGMSNSSEVISSSDDEQQCRERVVVQVWTDDDPPAEHSPKPGSSRVNTPDPAPILALAPGSKLRVRLRFEHQHFLFGDYDPLLGRRSMELRLNSATLQDTLPMEREQYFALPRYIWPSPPEERRDSRLFISKPDSLHIEAHIPGNQSYRFPERPVRYATKMRLSFWYLVAPGTEDECRARIMQYKDSPTAQRAIPEGGQEICLKTVGRWTKVERIFQTEPEATTLALDFRICGGADVGEVWIDDVNLEPLVTIVASP